MKNFDYSNVYKCLDAGFSAINDTFSIPADGLTIGQASEIAHSTMKVIKALRNHARTIESLQNRE